MNAHEILVAARNLIDREGWVQCALYSPKASPYGNEHQDHGGYCLHGAINQVFYGEPGPICGVTEDRRVVEAIEAIGGTDLLSFNNAPDRTKDEVRAVLDRAIAATAPPPADPFRGETYAEWCTRKSAEWEAGRI